MTGYSTELITRLKKYFKIMYKQSLSDEEADQYLNSLVDLYLLLVKNHRKGVADVK